MIFEFIVGVIVSVLTHLISGLSEAYDKSHERYHGSSRTSQQSDPLLGENSQREDEGLAETPYLPQVYQYTINELGDRVQLAQDSEPPQQFIDSDQTPGSTSEESQKTDSPSEEFIQIKYEQADGSPHSSPADHYTANGQGNEPQIQDETGPSHLPQAHRCKLKEHSNEAQLSGDTNSPQPLSDSHQGDSSSTSEDSLESNAPKEKLTNRGYGKNNGSIVSPQTGHCIANKRGNPTWLLQETEITRQLRQKQQTEAGSTSEDSQNANAPRSTIAHRESKQVDGSMSPSNRSPGMYQSLKKSLEASFTIMVVALALGGFGIVMLCLDLNTSNLCFEWNHRYGTLPFPILGWKLFGEVIEAIILNLWFPVTILLLFRWSEFRSNYISILYVGLTVGVLVAIYKICLLFTGVFRTKLFYRYPGNVLFIFGIIYNGVLLAQKIRIVCASVIPSSGEIMIRITNHFIFGFVCSMIFRYKIVQAFTETSNDLMKAMLAAATKLLTLVPIAFSKHSILSYTPEVVPPDRNFLLAYFSHGVSIILYRTMQADLNSRVIFIALSLLHGLLNFAGKTVQKFLVRMWAYLIARLRNMPQSGRHEPTPHDTPHHRRLKTDLQIQDMLFEDTALILSHAYLVLYLTTSFENSHWAVLKESLIRVFIGLGIDFVFNFLSISVQIHWFDIPILRVWLENWKLHVLAHAIILMVTECYFSPVLLKVFQVRTRNSPEEYTVKNCTLPFTSW